MAFFSKVGNILKQTASKQINAELSASRPSIYQAIRCMSSSKLFIGGLSYATDEQSLKESFSKYGEVMEARVILDRETGRSRGFGFITYTSSEEASSAIQALDGQELHGRTVRVNYATERPRQTWGSAPGNYGGGGGGGNYGGGNYGGSGGNYGGYGGNYGGSGGNYGGGDSHGSGGSYGSNYGGNSYGSGGGGAGDGGNYGGSNVNYGSAGNYGGNYEGGNSGPYGSSSVAAGDVGSDTFVGSGPGGGYDGSTGPQYGGGDQLGSNESSSMGSNESSSMGDPAGGFTPEDPVERNYRDDDDDAGDYAKRA